MRIYCFPYAGGSSSTFLKWRRHLSPYLDLRPVELQGHGSLMSTSCFIHMEDMITDIYERIGAELREEPFILLGHSMGSLIAWELASFIREHEDLHPYHLFLSGMKPPHLRDREEVPLHQLERQEFKDAVARLGGMPHEMIENDALFEQFEPILRADFQLCDNYKFKGPLHKINCGITAFGGLQDDISRAELEQWRLYGDYFQLRMYEGGHFFIDQHFNEMAAIINQTSSYLMYQ
ncbi:alpha/beta fold hydrolase [Paenibacillus thiaminolyticus]|uniref:thioesterase II family protein n=1 Tax=Paenibacillus thiaminolyticus TaxID=49283 RepID=UPI00233106EA|nr:alpha/beta fold hydrolase [Paenibacillus thiaminolyticus]WCF06621.1 alpha/beta fold hydrolase [Paenibacillus thiaminolyticus]